MKPDNQALQAFYGTMPLILILIGVWLRESLLLKNILNCLSNIEVRLSGIEASLGATLCEITPWQLQPPASPPES